MYTSIRVANFLFTRHDQHRRAKGHPAVLNLVATVYADWARRVGSYRGNKKYLLDWIVEDWDRAYKNSLLATSPAEQYAWSLATRAYREIKEVVGLL